MNLITVPVRGRYELYRPKSLVTLASDHPHIIAQSHPRNNTSNRDGSVPINVYRLSLLAGRDLSELHFRATTDI